jgi:hypothetical protein
LVAVIRRLYAVQDEEELGDAVIGQRAEEAETTGWPDAPRGEADRGDQVREAIARSEERHLTRVAAAWEQLTALFGYRLRPDLGVTFQTLATVLDATMRGLVMMASSTPDVAGDRVQARPFGAPSEEEWSLPALGFASVATGFLEPDPKITWDDDRLTAVRETLSSWSPPDV